MKKILLTLVLVLASANSFAADTLPSCAPNGTPAEKIDSELAKVFFRKSTVNPKASMGMSGEPARILYMSMTNIAEKQSKNDPDIYSKVGDFVCNQQRLDSCALYSCTFMLNDITYGDLMKGAGSKKPDTPTP